MDPHASPDGRLAPQAPRGTLLASHPDINQSKELNKNHISVKYGEDNSKEIVMVPPCSSKQLSRAQVRS